MSHLRRVLLVVVTALALVLPLSLSARAADPIATTTRVFTADHEPSSTVLTARVSSKSGVPKGSVEFFVSGNPDPLAAPVVVDATGAATLTVPRDNSASYTARFTGTDGYADSSGAPIWFGESVVMTAVGTILRVGGPGLLQVTQKFSAMVKYRSDGTPAVGESILFTQKNRAAGASGHPGMDPHYVEPVDVCTAIVDASGYATCSGTAPMSSIVTLLTVKSFANHYVFPSVESVYLPIISVG